MMQKHLRKAITIGITLSKSAGLYAGILSDDDLILNIDQPAVEYMEIFNNNVGIKPIIQLWNETVEHIK